MSITTSTNTSGIKHAKSEPVKEPVSRAQAKDCINCGGKMYKVTIEGILVWECSNCKRTCATE
ncbi:hypothetical protein TWF569_005893 [Orbilia oligospora]|uniref:Uncharacterized protein n=1 Tax=Orbilia oligospora TaxID=2813651 RepID=A0A7C8NQA6_ORBOL|nr:hypothetical protein TWF103_006028 [Orbilia oligospora]KAF3109757.1 hypothetical protein TWF102_009034 [Orbilia oligospora]KAF3116833.1 hypothetical protein TWF706_000058 [Orbilia oligospora]KAF3130434.1 hypothetical protein TWF703_008231 [Orbilia oligospora]KAF3142166.1 hypothetical protein TWF594_005531 [Orbilia oligospora]